MQVKESQPPIWQPKGDRGKAILKKKRGRNFGHLKGLETVKNVVINSIKLNIPIVTFYVFSSENWIFNPSTNFNI